VDDESNEPTGKYNSVKLLRSVIYLGYNDYNKLMVIFSKWICET